METAKIAVDSCYVLRQFLTPLPSIDFREIRGLDSSVADWRRDCEVRLSHAPVGGNPVPLLTNEARSTPVFFSAKKT